jgi:hypothetical protein
MKDKLTWDMDELVKALKIDIEDVEKYFTDGRRVSFILERRIANEILHGTIAQSEGAPYDVIGSKGRKWEVRSITKGGIYFCPSYMVGSGREFNESGFLAKLKEIDGYVVGDVEKFPIIPIWIISATQILNWWNEGKLGRTTKISRKKALKLVNSIE